MVNRRSDTDLGNTQSAPIKALFTFTLGYYPPLAPVISVQRKILKFQSARAGQNGRNGNAAEGRAAALHAQSARHDRGPCRIRCGRRWLLRRNCHTPLLLLGTMLLLG